MVIRKTKQLTQLKDHKECARDKPGDRTATCRCKVLKLERWVKTDIEPVVNDRLYSSVRNLIK